MSSHPARPATLRPQARTLVVAAAIATGCAGLAALPLLSAPGSGQLRLASSGTPSPSGATGAGPTADDAGAVATADAAAAIPAAVGTSGVGATGSATQLGTSGATTTNGTGSGSSGSAASSGSAHNVVVDPAQGWAMLVGISHYQSPTHPTYGGTGDVAAFRDALLRAGWSANHILVLTDGAATGDAIRSSMNWLVTHSGPNTFSLFHYSGHVLQQNGQEFLWGDDNTFISNNEFSSTLSRLQGRAWIDVAGCESAGFDQGLSSSLRFVTTSSMVNEKSYERQDWGESVWSGLTVSQGMMAKRADANRDGAVSIQEAVRWAQQQAPAMTANQQPYGPQHPYAVGGDGEWYLGPAMAPPPPPAPRSGSGSGGSGGSGSSGGQPSDRCGSLSRNTAHCTI